MRERLRQQDYCIDHRWLNRFCLQRTTKESGKIIVDGAELLFSNQSEIADGTEIEVWMGRDGFFYAEPSADIDARAAAKAEQKIREQAEAKTKEIERKAAAVAFNQALQIPVQWTPAIKDVLSGLSENSWGDGFNARTVIHIMLEEPLARGRLKRNEGDFLCTTTNGSNGKNWSGRAQENQEQQVCCKSCLNVAERLRLQSMPAAEKSVDNEQTDDQENDCETFFAP